MADKKFVGTFQSENQVLNKIDELKAQGYLEEDIYVVTNDEESLSIVRGRTDVDLESVKGNWLDRFMAFLSGDEPVQAAFTDMGFTGEESSRYYTEVKNGNILMYVDRNDPHLIHDRESEFISGDADPNLGSNLTVNHFDSADLDHNNVNVEEEQTVEVPVSQDEVNTERRAVYDETTEGEVFDDDDNFHIPTLDERMNKTPQTERLKYDSQTERDLL